MIVADDEWGGVLTAGHSRLESSPIGRDTATFTVTTGHKGSLRCRAVATDHHKRGHRATDSPVVGLTGARFGGAAGRRSRAAVPPSGEASAVASHHHRADQPVVGQTGARFPPILSPILSRWRREQQPDTAEPPAARSRARGGRHRLGMRVLPATLGPAAPPRCGKTAHSAHQTAAEGEDASAQPPA
jgi:hypothetical protein